MRPSYENEENEPLEATNQIQEIDIKLDSLKLIFQMNMKPLYLVNFNNLKINIMQNKSYSIIWRSKNFDFLEISDINGNHSSIIEKN